MKRGTPQHPKTRRLARAIGEPVRAAVGILEMLWHWASKFAVRGDVGRYSDADIAEAVEWDRDPAILIQALIDSGWLDVSDDPAIRLGIHDVQDHADDAWRKSLHRSAKSWWNSVETNSDAVSTPSRLPNLTYPNQTKPNQTKPKPRARSCSGGTLPGRSEGNPQAPTGTADGTVATTAHGPVAPQPVADLPVAGQEGRVPVASRLDEFCSMYPTRLGERLPMESARRWWRAQFLDDYPERVERLFAVMRHRIGTGQWTAERGRYVPAPERFLMSCPWEVEVVESATPPGDERAAAVKDARKRVAEARSKKPLGSSRTARNDRAEANSVDAAQDAK